MQTSRSPSVGASMLVALLLAAVCQPWLCAQQLRPAFDGERVRVSALALHFLTGEVLDRLHNGDAAAFDFAFSLVSEGGTSRTTGARFVISYDLWEERFSVTRLAREGVSEVSASHLGRESAEAWCLENISLSASGVREDRTFRARLLLRAERPGETGPLVGDNGISLGAIVDLLSRRNRAEQQTWSLESPPFRLGDARPKEPE